jgi:hypothetical protein
MKKLYTMLVTLAIFGFVAIIASCNDKNSNGNGNGGDNNGGTINLSNKNNVYFTLDGKKYKLWDKYTVQDLINAGYSFDPSLDLNGEYDGLELEGDYSQSVHLYKNNMDKVYVDIIFHQYWEKGVLKDRVICGFHSAWGEWETIGGLNEKSTREDVIKVLGEPSAQHEKMLMYDLFKKYDFSITFYFWGSSCSVQLYCDFGD